MANDDVAAVVIDASSGTIKAGYAGDDAPIATFSGELWSDMENLLHHAFENEINVDPAQHPILVVDQTHNSKENREIIAKVLFDRFRTPAMYMKDSAMASLYASGRTTGLVLHFYDNAVDMVPIFEGSPQSHAITKLDLAGKQVADICSVANEAITKCDSGIRDDLYESIVISGDTAMYPDIEDQVSEGVSSLAPSSANIRIVAHPERKNSAWIGGSIIASLPIFRDIWFSKQEYDIHGASLVHRDALNPS